MNWANPENALDLLAYAWYGLVLIVIAGVPSYFAARNHKAIKEVSDSVNNRPTTLRTDLDRAIAAVESLSHDVRGLRQDVASLDDVRRQQIADLRSDLEHRIGRRHP